MRNFKFFLNLFWQLLRTDLVIIRKNLLGNFVDTIIFISLSLVVVTYIYPQLGMTKDFGSLVAVGLISSSCLFQVWPAAVAFISDIEGNKIISYPLTLPLPSWLIFVNKALSIACKSMLISIIILPLSKLILLKRLDLSNFAVLKFIAMFFTVALFCGFFSLFMASIVKNMNTIDSVWTRVLFPLWFFGGAEYPWYVLNNLSPTLGTIAFFNPILYMMEGIRSTVLGQEHYLSFWLCLGMLWLLGFLLGFIGIWRIKRRLDFV